MAKQQKLEPEIIVIQTDQPAILIKVAKILKNTGTDQCSAQVPPNVSPKHFIEGNEPDSLDLLAEDSRYTGSKVGELLLCLFGVPEIVVVQESQPLPGGS